MAAVCLKACSNRLRPSAMRIYIGITGLLFALMFAGHVARVWIEGTQLLSEPIFIVTTLASLGLSVWAVLLLTRRPRHD
jgi:hypothetical protein